MGLNLLIFAQTLYGVEASSSNYTATLINFPHGGGLVSATNLEAGYTSLGGNFAKLGEVASTNVLLALGEPSLFTSILAEGEKIDYISDLIARTEVLGSIIPEASWQKDNDPYFSWNIIVEPVDLVNGFSLSLDTAPDFTIDTTDTHYQFPENSISSGEHTFYVLPSIAGIDWDQKYALKFALWVDVDAPGMNQLNPHSGQIVTDNLTPISCQLYDVDSGLDIETTRLTLNDNSVSFDYDLDEQLLKYTPTLGLPEGKITVLVNAYDLLGNNMVKGWDFIVDSRHATGSIRINAGEEFAHSAYVFLNIETEDEVSGIKQIYLSNDGVFDSELNHPYPYAPVVKDWMLAQPDAEGLKTVYAKFQDNAGNLSEVYQDDIILKLLTPETRIISGPASTTESIEADFRYEASVLGCVFSHKLDNADWSEWSSENLVHFTSLGKGNHYFYVKSASDLNSDGKITIDEEDSSPSLWVWTVQPEGYIEKLRKRILFWRR